MKITLKNVTNMITYSNIPANSSKVVFKYSDSKWVSENHSITVTEISTEEYEIYLYNSISAITNIYPPKLTIVNGIKLDNDYWFGSPDRFFGGNTTNSFLINIIKKHGDLYMYGEQN